MSLIIYNWLFKYMYFWRKTEIDKIEVFGIVFLIDSIQALLSAPNPDDPLSENIAKHWKTNEAEAVETGNVVSLHLAVSSKISWYCKINWWSHINMFYFSLCCVTIEPCSQGVDPFICKWCLMTWWRVLLPQNNINEMYAIHCQF